MSETGREPESFPDRIIFASMLNDITNWKSRIGKINVKLKRRKWLLTQQDSDLVGVSVQDQKKTWTCNEDQASHQVVDGSVTTCGRGAGTHGDVLNVHTEVFSVPHQTAHTATTTRSWGQSR